MDFETYYEELKSCSSELLRERMNSEEYREEYRRACERILREREIGMQQEPVFKEETTEEEPLNDLEREVPASFEECYKPDKVSEAIYDWSIGVKNWGYVLLAILILVGLVLSITGSFVTYTEMAGPSYDRYEVTREEFDVGLFLTNIFTWVIYAFVEFCVCKAVSLLLAALASIVRSNRITSNIALYNASKDK